MEKQRGDAEGFWAQRYSPWAKRPLLGVLVACFLAQTYLVYSDPPPEGQPISNEALAGKRLWQEHGCNFCHQLYGFGGFLGPDLTNAASRVTPSRLKELLRDGLGAMPAFRFSEEQTSALISFLRAMDASGQGQALLYADQDEKILERIRERVQGEHPSKIGTQAALPNALVAGSPPGERCITRPMSSSHRPALR